MTLQMLRLSVDMNALAQYAAERGFMHKRGHDEGRVLHHLLVETFGKIDGTDPQGNSIKRGAFQPFRLMASRYGASLYGYSTLALETMHEAARTFALPEALSILSLDKMQAKAMPETWGDSQILGFDLRTLPVVRLNSGISPSARQPDGWQAGAEVDAFLAHVLRQAPDTDPTMQEATREGTYLDWLAARLAPAAELIGGSTRLVRFRRIRTDRNCLGEAPEAVFHGSLRVTNPSLFAQMLARGVGRHCAYGFGMLLLRPPGSKILEG